jgi:acyl carrier protein
MLEVEDALDIQVDVEDFDRADLETVGTLATYVAGHVLADF